MPPPGVKARIDRFWRAIRRLREISEVDLNRFLSDENLIDTCERNLQIAIKATLDVCEALISYMKWRTPNSYREISLILLENKIIDEFLNSKFIEAIELRNILVHNYVYLNPKQIYNKISDLTNILIKIMNNVINYFKEKNIDP
ncbi:MAG: DUF86 domain-containing protein [Thermoproteota archaeon]|jgi:uncharacterized protein YutE (UPF0331/DUF86 family)|nr:DUF86 domain-containing protein [Thermoproteota archaeon]